MKRFYGETYKLICIIYKEIIIICFSRLQIEVLVKISSTLYKIIKSCGPLTRDEAWMLSLRKFIPESKGLHSHMLCTLIFVYSQFLDLLITLIGLMIADLFTKT